MILQHGLTIKVEIVEEVHTQNCLKRKKWTCGEHCLSWRRTLSFTLWSLPKRAAPNLCTAPRGDGGRVTVVSAVNSTVSSPFAIGARSETPPSSRMDPSRACGRLSSGRFVCGGKHQWAASVWQTSLLTLPVDDGKEPRLRVKTSSIACYLGPSSAGAEHTQTGLNTASVATRNVFLPYFCWRVRAAREKHLSSFFLVTLYKLNKP